MGGIGIKSAWFDDTVPACAWMNGVIACRAMTIQNFDKR